jgi:hydroxymethylpyrimidine/phosphomethylpyrimidine kinase
LRTRLLRAAALVTPNLHEAAALAGVEVRSVSAMREAARHLSGMGARAVLVKGGHLESDAVDVLYAAGEFYEFTAPRLQTHNTHGTGCTYSAAITAELAKGKPLVDAVASAKRFITEAIRTNPGLGRGCGPVNHHAPLPDGRGSV